MDFVHGEKHGLPQIRLDVAAIARSEIESERGKLEGKVGRKGAVAQRSPITTGDFTIDFPPSRHVLQPGAHYRKVTNIFKGKQQASRASTSDPTLHFCDAW